MNKRLIGALGALLLCLVVRVAWLKTELAKERAEHATAQAALEQCRAASAQTTSRAEALAQALNKAHAREAAWAEETAARAALVRNAKTGPRPVGDQAKVVDDDTRRAAMACLNRAW